MKQNRTELPRTKGQQSINKRGSNGIEETGGYASGSATLTNPGTHAPNLLGPNTTPKGKIAPNGITPNSPVGDAGTFDDMQDNAPNIDFKKFSAVAGKAKSNLGSKTNSKTISESEGKFKGAATAGGRAKAEGYGNSLATSYGKKGAHGSYKTAVG